MPLNPPKAGSSSRSEHKGTGVLAFGPYTAALVSSVYYIMSNIFASGGSTIYVTEGTYSYDGETWMAIYDWPLTVTNTNTAAGYLVIQPVSGITLSSTNCYFICNTDYIQFGSRSASRTTLYVTANNYGGLIQNGANGSNGQNYIRVYNINIVISNSNFAKACICRDFFGLGTTDNNIVCCSSSGDISPGGGGIVGQFSSNINVVGCWSSGSISDGAGGIVGANALNVNCDSCYSSGSIGSYGGGIVGERCDSSTITNCYSTGYISGQGGGICGYTCSNLNITACYSVGAISGNAGGIIGRNASSVSIVNCYTTGNISGSGGGCIAGPPLGSLTISNCYTSGQIYGGTGHIVGGSSSVPANCYAQETGTWQSVFANLVLQLNAWISTGTNTPYIHKNFGYSPYNQINIDEDGNLVRTSSQTIIAGQTTVAATSGSNFAILSDTGANTINSVSGAITGLEPGTYTLYIRGNGVTIFTLTVIPVPAPIPRVRARFSNNLVFYKAGSLSASGSMGVRNYRVISRKT